MPGMLATMLRRDPNPAASTRSRAAGAKGSRGFSFRERAAPVQRWVVHAPQTLRALVRADEIWLVVLAAFVGIAAGLLVVGINDITLLAHRLLFALNNDGRLSGLVSIDPTRAVAVPALGGLALGLTGLVIARYAPGRPVDPIEANALHGGRMSLRDSLIVVLQTLISNGAGASIGLEAGYTQIGSAVASRLGRAFRVRRGDLRVLVGCGAAGAIGAAFDAPLAGAFYAFELVIGTYSLATLAPVTLASISAIIVTHALDGAAPSLTITTPAAMEWRDYLPILVLGVVSGLVGIAIMRMVTLTESIFRRSRVPGWCRPGIGGLIVGSMALVTPAVLSSGHAALRLGLNGEYGLEQAALLLALKALASAISIGSGFRGGLFFASLFLGVLTGTVCGDLLSLATTESLPPVTCALICMSALAVAIVGGPLTMVFLALESTGSLPLTVAVLVASVVSALTVRRTFGYSFATWRFHLRGESIRSALDIGWIRNLTVGRMMRRELRTLRADTSIASVRRDYPLGSAHRVVVVDERGRYAGIVQVPDLHAAPKEVTRLGELLEREEFVLLPQMNVKEAIALFEKAESDALVVVDDVEQRNVIGLLTEQHALRRYSEELDRSRRELSGE
jgi:chloride channel protein, CIC family